MNPYTERRINAPDRPIEPDAQDFDTREGYLRAKEAHFTALHKYELELAMHEDCPTPEEASAHALDRIADTLESIASSLDYFVRNSPL